MSAYNYKVNWNRFTMSCDLSGDLLYSRVPHVKHHQSHILEVSFGGESFIGYHMSHERVLTRPG